MKKKLLFLQCLVLCIVLVFSVGAKAQTATQVTLSGSPDAITPVIFTAGSENVAYLYATNAATFCGMQVDLILPEGVSITKISNSTLTKTTDEFDETFYSHSVRFGDKGEYYTILVYNSDLQKFNGNNGALAKLAFSVSDSFIGGTAYFKKGLYVTPQTNIEDSEVIIYETNHPDFGNYVEFVDANVKALCVANWDTNGDGELSYDEAMAVTSLGEVFRANNNITSFNELQNFTGLSEIGDNAFSYCSSLTGITIPNSVTKIGDYAFSDCSGLTNLTIPNSVTSIGSNTFWCCQGLMNMTIPNSVTEIGSYAFAGCSGLNSVTISNCVTAIGEHTFDACSNLTNVTIPNSVTLIGEQAFSHCSSLTNMTVPDSVTEIGGYAFDYCSSLASVTIPNSVTWIGNEAFRGCNSLKHVYVDWDTPLDAFNHLFQSSIFGKVYYIQDATLHVPVYTKRKYAAATVWQDFGRIISFNDVNMDGVLTVADVTGVMNFILDTNTNGLWAAAADVNEDSKYLVDDLKDEVDLVLMGLTPAKDENKAKGMTDWANIVFTECDNGELVVCMNEVDRYVGIQFDLMLPNDVELIGTRAGKGAAGYAVKSQKLDNGLTRVVAYAMNTKTINDAEVIRLKLNSTDGAKDKVCDVVLQAISLSTPMAQAVFTNNVNATVTLGEATGINSIHGENDADAIYNMQGQKLVKMRNGINLTNGKKFIKR